MKAIINQAQSLFEQVYQTEPGYFFQSPGRINLIGDYSDCYDGLALCCAINFHTVIAAKPTDNEQFRVVFSGSAIKGCELIANKIYHWQAGNEGEKRHHADALNYLKGITHIMVQSGLKLTGMDIAVVSNIPKNMGLGSSAALQTAFGSALNLCSDQPLSAPAIAQLAQKAETLYLQHTCGVMSQMSCVLAEANSILMFDSLDLDCQPVPFLDDIDILVIKPANVNAKSEQQRFARLQQCQTLAEFFNLTSLRYLNFDRCETAKGEINDAAVSQVSHLLHENQRAHKMVKAFRRKNFADIQTLMKESELSLIEDYGTTNEQALAIGRFIDEQLNSISAQRLTADQTLLVLLPKEKTQDLLTELKTHYPCAKTVICHPVGAAGPVPTAEISSDLSEINKVNQLS